MAIAYSLEQNQDLIHLWKCNKFLYFLSQTSKLAIAEFDSEFATAYFLPIKISNDVMRITFLCQRRAKMRLH